jgi:hypothetical protein
MADFSLKRISRQMSQLLGRTAPFLELGIDVEELENSQKKSCLVLKGMDLQL